MFTLKKGSLTTSGFFSIYEAIDFFKSKFSICPDTMFLTQKFCDSAGIKIKLDRKVPVICVGLPTYLSSRLYCFLRGLTGIITFSGD